MSFQTASRWDVTKQAGSLLFHLFGYFHSSIYIAPDVKRHDSLLKGYNMEVSPSVARGSTERFGVDDMLPLPLLGVGVQFGLH